MIMTSHLRGNLRDKHVAILIPLAFEVRARLARILMRELARDVTTRCALPQRLKATNEH